MQLMKRVTNWWKVDIQHYIIPSVLQQIRSRYLLPYVLPAATFSTALHYQRRWTNPRVTVLVHQNLFEILCENPTVVVENLFVLFLHLPELCGLLLAHLRQHLSARQYHRVLLRNWIIIFMYGGWGSGGENLRPLLVEPAEDREEV